MRVEDIKKRIEQLKAEREQLMMQANLQLAKLTGSIEALEAVLEDADADDATHPTA